MEAVRYLEDQGVQHRDIKPDNIGIAEAPGSGRKRLVLFDFSLARTAPENIEAGTRPAGRHHQRQGTSPIRR